MSASERDGHRWGEVLVAPSAIVSPEAVVGPGTRIWHQAQVREGAQIGSNCTIGMGAYIDLGVRVGSNVKIEDYACVYQGAVLEDGVFVGPHVVLANDKLPRAINPDGTLKASGDWRVGRIVVRRGATIGANAVVLPGVTIGEFALIAAGAIVTRDVPRHGLLVGNPGRLVSFVCACGHRLERNRPASGETVSLVCLSCGRGETIGCREYRELESRL